MSQSIIDADARRAGARLLRKFLGQELTNDQLEDAWPESGDAAIKQIFDAVWGLYDDLHEHLYVRSPVTDDLLRRCIDFLESSHQYSWPVPNALLQLLAMPLSLVTLGLANRLLWRKYRFPEYWPFPSRETRSASQHKHGQTS